MEQCQLPDLYKGLDPYKVHVESTRKEHILGFYMTASDVHRLFPNTGNCPMSSLTSVWWGFCAPRIHPRKSLRGFDASLMMWEEGTERTCAAGVHAVPWPHRSLGVSTHSRNGQSDSDSALSNDKINKNRYHISQSTWHFIDKEAPIYSLL